MDKHVETELNCSHELSIFLRYHMPTRSWVIKITWTNSCKSSCKISFSFYKISCWKFEKYNKKRQRTPVNFVWVKILQKILQLTVIVNKLSNFFRNFYKKEINRRALLSFSMFPKFRIRCKDCDYVLKDVYVCVYKKNLSGHLENWPEGHDAQGFVHLNISSTFVKHLERLFTPKNQDNSEKGNLVVSLPRSQKPFFHRSFLTWNFLLFSNLQSKIGVLV